MGILDSIFKNESMQAMAFNQVKSLMAKTGTKAILLTLDETGEVQTQMYDKEVKAIDTDTLQTLIDNTNKLAIHERSNGDITDIGQQ